MAAAAGLIGWVAAAGTQTYRSLRETISGLDQIALGALFFAIAILISLAKAGVPRKLFARWNKKS